MGRKGFTLLELIIVIIIIGVLATLGFTQYARVVERGRTSEAKTILGQIRTAEEAFMLENGAYTATMADLAVDAPTDCSGTTHYFSYSTDGVSATATRCDAGGKTPVGPSAYIITVGLASGAWGGTQGYF